MNKTFTNERIPMTARRKFIIRPALSESENWMRNTIAVGGVATVTTNSRIGGTRKHTLLTLLESESNDHRECLPPSKAVPPVKKISFKLEESLKSPNFSPRYADQYREALLRTT